MNLHIDDISIGEGTVLRDPKDMQTQLHAFETLGYGRLKQRYGIKPINIWERPFEKVDLGDGVAVKFNTDILNADFVVMKPTPAKKKTILFGKCMHQANKDNPDIQEMIAIKGCPPKPESVYQALQKAGIEVDPSIFENMDLIPGKFLKRYAGKPEFDESFFKIV